MVVFDERISVTHPLSYQCKRRSRVLSELNFKKKKRGATENRELKKKKEKHQGFCRLSKTQETLAFITEYIVCNL